MTTTTRTTCAHCKQSIKAVNGAWYDDRGLWHCDSERAHTPVSALASVALTTNRRGPGMTYRDEYVRMLREHAELCRSIEARTGESAQIPMALRAYAIGMVRMVVVSTEPQGSIRARVLDVLAALDLVLAEVIA